MHTPTHREREKPKGRQRERESSCVVSMAGTCIRFIMVVILCLSYHMSMNEAIPFTRSSNLVQKIQSHEVSKTALLENPKLVVRRMEIEVNDYPGSGANNRHTPRPQLGRGCNDC